MARLLRDPSEEGHAAENEGSEPTAAELPASRLSSSGTGLQFSGTDPGSLKTTMK